MFPNEISDRLAIRELIELYSLSLSRRDWETVAQCFHPEAEWRADPPFAIELRTRQGIRDGISALVEPHEFLVQMTHSIVISLSGECATATSLIEEVGRMPAGQGGIRQYGIYHDELTRRNGRWGFARRRFQPVFLDTAAAVTGSLPGSPRS